MPKDLFTEFGASFELEYFRGGYERKLSRPTFADYVIPGVKGALVDDTSFIAVHHWCKGNPNESKIYAAKCVEHATEYFFGQWRKEIPTDLKTLDSDWWRKHATWVSPLSTALCWASSLGNWEAVKEFAEYPTNKTNHGMDATREDAAAYLALACLLRNDPFQNYEHCFDIIRNGKKRKPKLIADVILALQKRDAVEFQNSLESYLQYFRKSEFKRTSIDKLLSLDGTTLLNIGTRDGLPFKVPANTENHIIRFD